ncbi:MAG: HPF/RaiA family ribosome-associated protein [Desulfobacterota bacterium]|jgi:putative sigma-54 modulation protein|nr:HPF/RaiA family ribosome-associated protein [Thermodesulfobacteriota bacterium]
MTDDELMMKIRIHPKGILTIELNEYVQKRLHFALGRFSARIDSAIVRISGCTEPLGTISKECRIFISLGRLNMVNVAYADPDIHTAIDRAAGRASRAVARRLEQERSAMTLRQANLARRNCHENEQ